MNKFTKLMCATATVLFLAGCSVPTATTTPATDQNDAPATAAADQEKPAAVEWNKKEIDVVDNGNIPVAVDVLKGAGDIKAQATTPAAGEVFKAPWNHYGKVVKLTGAVAIVQEYPPESDIAAALESDSVSEMVLIAEDGTLIDFIASTSSGDVQVGSTVAVYGYPVGHVTVDNKLGGQTEQLAIVGNAFDIQ
ncbi:hypothetical protein CBW65_12670 [Tumebacillus avium]|uniref:DUF5666 domain-containing protein n=1 Tax=Tumebacillus avium TaxID=1903704 RepID=A0A1Y0IQR6_9BACL|nr:hypothetical protein [Tumebacillus avium]ARU61785.1 hypothetical protein CBW65_12670 [Tumebacillus avium]